jgi:hypothetical protein
MAALPALFWTPSSTGPCASLRNPADATTLSSTWFNDCWQSGLALPSHSGAILTRV